MAKPKPAAQTTGSRATETKEGLPQVESPSISPAEPQAEIKPIAAPAVTVESTSAPAAKPAFKLRPRHKRLALLAASLTLAATLGSVVGAVTTRAVAVASKPEITVAALEERKAVQQSIAHLSKEVAALRTNLDAANRTAHSEMNKIAARLAAAEADITASITPPQTVQPAPAPQEVVTPLPVPRPSPNEIAAAQATVRPAVVTDWSLRAAREGVAYVVSHGEVYEAVLGAPLPGLGPVQTIKREGGHWMVVTPRGIIVSMRDRHYFEY